MTPSYKDKSSDRLTRIMYSVAVSLVATGIVSAVAMSTQLSRLEERIKGLDERVLLWMKTNGDRLDYATKQIDQITKEQRDSDRRLGIVEGRMRF